MKNYSSSTAPWYSSRSSIKTVIIEDGVTSIGNYAFYECSGLTAITIPNSVTSIGERAFYRCSSLTSITIPNSVTSIGEETFSGCSKLTFITIPNSVTSIGEETFSGCSKLTSITIPNSVTSIGEKAFYQCSSLTSVTIGESVTSIGNYAFKGCSKLATVIWNAKKCNDISSSDTPFYYYHSSSSDNFDLRKQIKSFTFGDNVESIPASFCSGMSNLTTITIPNSVTSIGNYAFYDCSSLTSLTIGESVTSIGSYAFKGCSKLATVIWNAKKINDFSSSNTPFYHYYSSISSISDNFDLRQQITSFTFGDNVESIPAYLCSGMSNLTSITISNSVTSIGAYAFRDCSSLTSVNISDLTAWLNIIFGNAYSNPLYYAHNLYLNETLVTDLIVPNSINIIERFAFYNCSSLTSVTIPNSVTSIGSGAFYDCSSLTSITIPTSVTSIGEYAFYNCSNITSDLNLNNVETIGQQAFSGCSSLTKVVIGDGATSIGQQAFYGCTYLEDIIIIGSGINVDNGIGENAFNGCRYLLSVTCKAIYPPVINANVFEGCGVLGGIDLYVPEKSVARYKKADVWSEFNIVGKDLSIDDPTNPTNPEDGKFTITWQNEDGNVIKTDEVEQGTMPAYTGTTPTKEGYEFAGWLPNIKPATKDICYTTYFIPTQQAETPVYTVNINGENCSLNINNQYPEGSVITLEAVADECFEFQQWSDGNKDNPRTVTVTKDMNLTAEFNKLRYTITDMTEPGAGGKIQVVE